MNKQEFLTKIHEYDNYSIKVLYDENQELKKAFVKRILFQEDGTRRLEPGRCIYFNNTDYKDCFNQIKDYIEKEAISRNPLNRIAVLSEREYGISVFRFNTEEEIKSAVKSMFEIIEKNICTTYPIQEPVNPIPDLSVVPESLIRTAKSMIEGYENSLKYYNQIKSAIDAYQLAKEGNTMTKLHFLFDMVFEDLLYDNAHFRIEVDYFSE